MTKMDFMFNLITIVLLLTTITTTTTVVTAYRIPRNDIISGTDFLTLFMNSDGSSESSGSSSSSSDNKSSRQPKRIIHTITHDDSNDGILPIETMFSSKEELYGDSSNYYTYHNYRNNRKFSIDSSTPASTTISATTINEPIISTTTLEALETEMFETNIETTTPRTTTTTAKSTDSNNEENKSTKSEFKVLSVSVSTSVGKVHVSTSTKTFKPNRAAINNQQSQQRTQDQRQEDSVNQVIRQKENEADETHVSNSFKSELSIEEDDELTGLHNNHKDQDSANGASTNIHSIVAPPISSRPEGFSLDFTYSPQQSQPRSRTQRKQDAIVPYQTVVYHDNQNTKDTQNKEPQQPISYSSVGQSISQLKSWQDIDSLSPPPDNPEEMKSESKTVITPKSYSEPAKVYSEPAKVYSEPAKIYSEPAKIYSEPAKIYSEPAKVYSEPAKNYGVPAKVYSKPAWHYSNARTTETPPTKTAPTTMYPTTTRVDSSRRTVFNELDKIPYDKLNAPADDKQKKSDLHNNIGKFIPSTRFEHNSQQMGELPQTSSTSSSTSMMINYSNSNDKNLVTSSYEIKPSNLLTPSITSPPQTESDANGKAAANDDSKIGYVVEGRNYRKYRVEEKTSDGFIVGEYGVVSHNDGTLRGVRYTADSNINPRLIYDALLKFLSL